jgi:RNA polymerase primary sigma factor
MPVRAGTANLDGAMDHEPIPAIRRPQHRLLTSAEEVHLARAAQAGDRGARRTLIEANLRLVTTIAKEFHGLGVPAEDLFQEGAIGLTQAVERYDWQRETRFATYARWWIRRSIMNALTEQARTIRLPQYLVARQVVLRRAAAALTARLRRPPTADELATETGMTAAEVSAVLSIAATTGSLNERVGFDDSDDGAERLDLLADPRAPDPALVAETDDRHDAVAVALSHLPRREREVVVRRFGVDRPRAESLEEIAADFGLTRERVRQIQEHALAALGHELPPEEPTLHRAEHRTVPRRRRPPEIRAC